ncbi:Antitermination protein [Cedecea lapagei]|uniref:Antitermination protein n=2 Tax=Cedecea lapagei TaxID=158823 RepID=A0A447V260_9ENTR|nr:Antitermination protein [Cedecea lapagei]
MAAQGMVQSRAPLGFSAFMGKMGVSSNDREKAIELLTQHALDNCDKVPALRKLSPDIKPAVMQILAIYAYADYSRSAASTRECDCCSGTGFVDAEVFTMKTSGWGRREIKETTRLICHKCKGKKVISTACRDCKGRGKALNEKETKRQGVPVMGDCKQCGGSGYSRIPSTEVHAAVCDITDGISLDTWKKSVKSFYDSLSTELDIQESNADRMLKKATA